MHTPFFEQGVTACDFGSRSPHAINVEETTTSISQRFGFYMVSKGSDFITASLALFIDGVSLLYVASNGAIELVCLVQPRYSDKNFLSVVSSDHGQLRHSNW